MWTTSSNPPQSQGRCSFTSTMTMSALSRMPRAMPAAQEKLEQLSKDPELASMGTCMVKTHLSLSHDPTVKGRPRGFTLPVRDILLYQGAGFTVPVTGDIKLMPGTCSDPAFRRIDVDTATGKVKGLY